MDLSGHNGEWGKKLIGIVAVIAIHIVVIYALLNGLGKQIIAAIKQIPIEVSIIAEVPLTQPAPAVAPVVPPKVATPPRPFVPKLEVAVRHAPLMNVIQDVTNEPVPASTTVAETPTEAVTVTKGPVIVNPVVDFSTCTKPEYPRSALRNEEQGTVRIQFLIGADGRVADSKIEKSSGYRALDGAAVNALRLCQFRPGTVDGKPQQSWTTVDYVWKLPD